LGGERYGLFRLWESPEDGDEPFGTLTDRDTALLAAAFLPLVDRARSFSVDPEDAGGPLLYRDGRAVGRIRYGNPELMEALNLADGLARSPASIASFLEAAGAAALELAGKILVRNPHPQPLSQKERGEGGRLRNPHARPLSQGERGVRGVQG
jgi:hypothetical protein